MLNLNKKTYNQNTSNTKLLMLNFMCKIIEHSPYDILGTFVYSDQSYLSKSIFF